MLRFPKALTLVLLVAGPLAAQPLGLGRTALPAEIAAWDTDIRPDGRGLPDGEGSALEGESLYTEKCAACHGDFGEGVDRWPVLAGGQGTLRDSRPVKTLGSYWPYLSTAWDYIYRAMPYGDAASLTPGETYALVAYLLYLNDLVEDDFTLTRDGLAAFSLPNAPSFRNDDRPKVEYPALTTACMTDCKDKVDITARALDVTPD